MTVDEAKGKLAHFTIRNRDRPGTVLADVHLNGNFAYASDGKIAFRASVDHEVDKDSGRFPFKAIDEFAQCVDGASQWMEMDLDKFMKVGEMFLQALRAYEVEQRSDILTRYKRCQCPCCGNDVYWDGDCNELVEFDDVEEVDYNPTNVDFPVRINLHGGTHLYVAFGYLYLIRKVFGTEVLFSREVVEEGCVARLLVKTPDGAVMGMLMPLRAPDEDFVPEHIIDTHAYEGGVKEASADGKAD